MAAACDARDVQKRAGPRRLLKERERRRGRRDSLVDEVLPRVPVRQWVSLSLRTEGLKSGERALPR